MKLSNALIAAALTGAIAATTVASVQAAPVNDTQVVTAVSSDADFKIYDANFKFKKFKYGGFKKKKFISGGFKKKKFFY